MKKQQSRSTPPIFVINLLVTSMLLLNYTANAQCSIITCSTPTYSFSMATTLGTSTFTGDCIVVSAGVVLTIAGNVNFSGTQVQMGTGSEIRIVAGGSLTITASDLYAPGDMWKGIEVEEDGAVTVSNSRINGAYVVIECHATVSSTSTAVTLTNNSCLLNNEIGVLLEAPNAGYISFLMEDTEISAASLKNPLSGEPGDYGVLLIGSNVISGLASFQIGNTSPYTGSTTSNYIHDVAIGIRCYYANARVQNCRISNTLNSIYLPTATPIIETFTSGNIGILATSDNSSPNLERNLQVGLSVTGAGVYNNLIDNVVTDDFDGIIAASQVNTIILSNNINGGILSGGNYILRRGIQLLFPKSSHTVSNNWISDFDAFGIRMVDITTGTTEIENNMITRSNFPSGGESPYGISVNNATPTSSHAVTIEGNTIEKVQTGIFLRNHSNADIQANNMTYSKGGPGGTGHGALAENNSGLYIGDNYLESDCSTCSVNRIGMQVTDCPGVDIHGNYLYNTTVGTMISASAVNGNMNCNEFHDCRVGVGLDDIDVSVFGGFDFGVLEGGSTYYINNGTGIASDNSWYPTTTANRERHFGSTDVPDLNWRYRDLLSDLSTSAPEYDIPTGLTVPPLTDPAQFSAVLTNTTDPECGYLFRMSDLLPIEDALEYMEQAYANAGSMVDAPITASEYYRRWQFWQEVNSWEGLDALLSDDLTAYLNSIAASNIPIFQEIQDSIARSNYVYANALNSSITAESPVEEFLQTAYSIYLNQVNESGRFKLTAEDKSTLLAMAQSDPNEYGMGVHVAAAMLDTIFYNDYVLEEDIEFETRKFAASGISMFPNPVTSNLQVDLAGTNNGILTLYNISGGVMYTSSLESGVNNIDFTWLSEGMYLIKVRLDSGRDKQQLIIKN